MIKNKDEMMLDNVEMKQKPKEEYKEKKVQEEAESDAVSPPPPLTAAKMDLNEDKDYLKHSKKHYLDSLGAMSQEKLEEFFFNRCTKLCMKFKKKIELLIDFFMTREVKKKEEKVFVDNSISELQTMMKFISINDKYFCIYILKKNNLKKRKMEWCCGSWNCAIFI